MLIQLIHIVSLATAYSTTIVDDMNDDLPVITMFCLSTLQADFLFMILFPLTLRVLFSLVTFLHYLRLPTFIFNIATFLYFSFYYQVKYWLNSCRFTIFWLSTLLISNQSNHFIPACHTSLTGIHLIIDIRRASQR